jgi:hypothetical protein
LRASIAALAGLPVAWLTVAISSFATNRAAQGLTWRDAWFAATRFVDPTDFAIGAAILVAQLAVILLLSFASLPWITRTRWPLPIKIFLAWICLLLLRTVFAALGTSIFPVSRLS